jgi:hypothetical protein
MLITNFDMKDGDHFVYYGKDANGKSSYLFIKNASGTAIKAFTPFNASIKRFHNGSDPYALAQVNVDGQWAGIIINPPKEGKKSEKILHILLCFKRITFEKPSKNARLWSRVLYLPDNPLYPDYTNEQVTLALIPIGVKIDIDNLKGDSFTAAFARNTTFV